MNRLLKKYHIIISLTLLIEVFILGILFVLLITNDDISNDVTLTYYLLSLCILFACIDFIESFIFGIEVKKGKNKAELTSAEIIGSDINEAYNFGQIGLAVCDNDGVVMWLNDFLNLRFVDLIDQKITDVFPNLLELYDEAAGRKENVKIIYENRIYMVQLLHDVKLLAFKDITDYENEVLINHNLSPVVGFISIDNYSDVQMSISDDSKFNDLLIETRTLISNFANESFSMLKQIKDDKYIFITTMENYYKLYEDKFSIVDKVRNADSKGFTISLGVSYGIPDYSKLSDEASSALDVALARGGDQAVIAPFGQSMIYLGGRSELKPSRNRVKIRSLSNSFVSILKDFDKAIIMGHTNSDFDSFGSCLGILTICKHAGVSARICFEDQLVEEKCRVAVKSNFSDQDMKQLFIKYKEINDFMDKKTILIICDHNNPAISMFPDLDKKIKNIAIIDHHRQGAQTYLNPIFSGVDTSSSSACEIVTNYISFNLDDIKVDERTATFLLAGIALDTSFFKKRASNSTFEASAILKQYNADGIKVEEFLKENLEEYRQKIAILNNSETPYNDTIVAISKNSDIISNIMVSMVSDEGVRIKGISLAVCIGRVGENEIKISARSDGSVNCQILMEKLGGGGHYQMAAASLNDIDVDEAKKRLYQVFYDYLDDAKQSHSTAA